jgi:two-component system, sensor histidine kinase and response regulator
MGISADQPAQTRIMIVDDTPQNLRLLEDVLRGKGYQVFALPNGEMALKAAAMNPPDLILLDIRMPGLNGYEVCERLKADQQTADIPIIFLSALDNTEDKVKAFQAGGVDYITKPFRFEEVDARVGTHLRLRNQQHELQESYRKLKQLEELRDNLVHMLAHDMRTPLTVMTVHLDLMAEIEMHSLSPKGAKFLATAMASTASLIEMVTSMLDISRMEAGQLSLDLAEYDLAEIISEVLDKLDSLKGNREILVDLPAPLRVRVDRELIARVIQNLADNALKFSLDKGCIRIGALQAGAHVRVLVEDNGPGIPPEYRQKIFEKFGQVEARNKGKVYSTGLGLTFCKLAIEAHGGSIGIDSEAEKGSTFWFELPRVSIRGEDP